MKDDTRELLDSILAQWHRWCSSYSAIASCSAAPMFREVRPTRQWETMYDINDRQIEDSTMEAVDFHVSELPADQRTALQINARNLVTGRSVWTSARLPTDLQDRAMLLGVARAALVVRLSDAGIL